MLSRRALLTGLAAAPLLAAAGTDTAPVAVWIFAHQDDELLSAGSSIISHRDGGVRCVLVCATDGSATAARRALAERLGREVTTEQITAYRDAEWRWTARTGLRVECALPPPGVRMVDGQATLEQSRALIEWAQTTWPGARIKTHSPWDTHSDHRALALAAHQMWEDGQISDLRHYVPGYILRQRASLEQEGWEFPRLASSRRPAAVSAQAAYRLWSPPPPGVVRDRYYQVGYTSAGRSFRAHAADPVSRYHAPVPIPAHLSTLEAL